MKISVIVPCFNAADKIGRCLASLRTIDFVPEDFEVIFVDDCSTDGTYELLQAASAGMPSWHVLRLEQNSGSPSRPRNRGIDTAQGEYIYFLDCDDEILPTALTDQYELASRTGADLVRSELLAEDGRERRLMNQLPDWKPDLSLADRRELIIRNQSTVPTSFIKTALVRKHQIRWPDEIRMGEDTLFLATALLHAERVEYLASPTYVYYKLPSLTPASTQRYGARELRDHLHVWTSVQGLLKQIGIDYFRTRLHVGLRVALESLIFRNRGDVDQSTFSEFQKFVIQNSAIIDEFKYSKRLKDLIVSAQKDALNGFNRLCRPRLLIAGYDLKFIKDAIPDLSTIFDIQIDEWKGHAIHDEHASLRLIEWAELIWCEWLLKNVEWYANHKRPNQRLVVRMHRMELGRSHGENMNVEKIDAIITVSALFFERLLERFPNIPRAKVRLIDNYVRANQYRNEWHPDRLSTLGLIGILPARKGLMRALRILHTLKQQDSRFRLEIFGHKPEDVSWVSGNQEEMNYFKECMDFIDSCGLLAAISFNGHSNVKTELADRKVGFVLSVSDSESGFPGPESFHLAVGDAFAAGSIGLIQKWLGSEYIWPSDFIFESEIEIVQEIMRLRHDKACFNVLYERGRAFLEERYNVHNFTTAVKELFLELA